MKPILPTTIIAVALLAITFGFMFLYPQASYSPYTADLPLLTKYGFPYAYVVEETSNVGVSQRATTTAYDMWGLAVDAAIALMILVLVMFIVFLPLGRKR